MGWGGWHLDPEPYLRLLFHSRGTFNRMAYSNPEVDRLLDEARTELDTQARHARYRRVEELIFHDHLNDDAQRDAAVSDSSIDRADARVQLVVLDLKMPRMDGFELLDELKASPRWRPTPAVVLSTSREANDRTAAYRRGAAGFIVKPIDFSAYVEVVRVLDRYWTLNELP